MRSLSMLAGAAIGLSLSVGAAADPGYFRFPAVHGDTLVFTSEGDLWSAPLAGGDGRRLTTHAAAETQAAISPDGRLIAFAASYDGPVEVYAMPLAGGVPKRLTFDSSTVTVAGWTPDGKVVYASDRLSGPGRQRVLRAVDPTTGIEQTYPLSDANEAAFDDRGGTIYFTRRGLHLTADNAARYRGGAMAEIWRYTLGSTVEAQRLAGDVVASLRQPMWWQGRLYYLSDVEGSYNLWSMAADGSDRKQVTQHQGWDVKSPRLGSGRIVYQLGADIRSLDLASGTDRVVPLRLVSDFEQAQERWLRKPLAYFTSARFGGDGKRVAVTARGRVVVAGPGPQRRVELPLPGDSRARSAVPSHDGRHVYVILDAGGSNEIWRFAADGSGKGTALTKGGTAHRFRIHPSPDGKWLAHDDKQGRLWLLDLASGRDALVDDAPFGPDDAYTDVRWSHDSATLAYSRADTQRQVSQVVLVRVSDARKHVLTSDRYESYSPAWSRDGKWLYFLSNRSFVANPGGPWGDRNMGPAFDRRGKLYALSLRAGERFPFQAPDELAPGDAGKSDAAASNGNGGKDAKTAKADVQASPKKATIDWDGLADRLFEVPLAPGNYTDVQLDAERAYLLEADSTPDAKPTLKTLAISANAPQPETFLADVRAFELSNDGKKLYLMKWTREPSGEMLIVDAGAKMPADASKSVVRVGDWVQPITPTDEWREMFVDAWRMHRDFSFEPGMRGADWNAVRAKYEPLVARVTDRAELDDLLGQMISELGILHSQVRGAEHRADAENPAAATLGADIDVDAQGLVIRRIWRTDPELPSERGPLQQPGVDARDGDRLLSVNGRPVRSRADLAGALAQQAGQQVLLELARGSAAPHKTVVLAVAPDRDAQLRMSDWEQGSRARVEAAGKGRIGYLHLRAMGPNDIAEFAREFYANVERDGLVIDVRRNNGGNIDSWILEKLMRKVWAYWQPPGVPVWQNMQQTFRGHLAVLIDDYTYSDGETFAAGVQALKLGPLIGTRTAGAGVWLSPRNTLVDNGIARIGEFGQFRASDGQWLIEGYGVRPDIEVDNPPLASFNGEDLQLQTAIETLQRRIRESPIPPLKAQPVPKVGTPATDGR